MTTFFDRTQKFRTYHVSQAAHNVPTSPVLETSGTRTENFDHLPTFQMPYLLKKEHQSFLFFRASGFVGKWKLGFKKVHLENLRHCYKNQQKLIHWVYRRRSQNVEL